MKKTTRRWVVVGISAAILALIGGFLLRVVVVLSAQSV